jgi:hypothetical protein
MLLHLLTAAIGTNLPIRNVRFHGESWRVSGRATEIAEMTFVTHIGHVVILGLSSIATGSLWFDVGGLDHPSPFLDLALDELPEIFGRSPLRCDQHIA